MIAMVYLPLGEVYLKSVPNNSFASIPLTPLEYECMALIAFHFHAFLDFYARQYYFFGLFVNWVLEYSWVEYSCEYPSGNLKDKKTFRFQFG